MTATLSASKTVPRHERRPMRHVEETGVQFRAVDAGATLPPGVCGRIVVTALSFNVLDTYGTMFAPGCADRSIGQRVPAGKIPLLTDHENEVRKHVGVVRGMPTVGDAYLGECDILDTEDGRRFLEYAKACVAAGAVTGASIRFVPRDSENLKAPDGRTYERFTEVELRELTIVPLSSVPNTDLLAVRKDAPSDAPSDTPVEPGPTTDEGPEVDVDGHRDDATLLGMAARAALDAMAPDARAALLKDYTETAVQAPARDDAATPPAPTVRHVTMDERLAALRTALA